jgi:hypothetical protein
MRYNVTYSLHYKILKLYDPKASRYDLFQNNSTPQFSYSVMNIRKPNLMKLWKIGLPKLWKIGLPKNKDHCQASLQHLGQMWPTGCN